MFLSENGAPTWICADFHSRKDTAACHPSCWSFHRKLLTREVLSCSLISLAKLPRSALLLEALFKALVEIPAASPMGNPCALLLIKTWYSEDVGCWLSYSAVLSRITVYWYQWLSKGVKINVWAWMHGMPCVAAFVKMFGVCLKIHVYMEWPLPFLKCSFLIVFDSSASLGVWAGRVL